MSTEPPEADEPPEQPLEPGQPPAEPPESRRAAQPPARNGGGSVVLGIVVGVLFLAALVEVSSLLANVPYFPLPSLVLFVAYVVAAAVLAGRPRTARFGAGLLIAIGVSLLLAAGVCVALLAGVGRAAPAGPPR